MNERDGKRRRDGGRGRDLRMQKMGCDLWKATQRKKRKDRRQMSGYSINRSMAGEAAEELAKGIPRMAGRIDKTGWPVGLGAD